MWLISTTEFRLESFIPPNIPEYVILSHTWGNEEVSFAEFSDLERAGMKGGCAKIKMTCQLARDRGIQYAWVDTCCIDKSSSAELSESINSMYNWYRQSKVCFAYIDDWSPECDWADLASLEPNDDKDSNANLNPEALVYNPISASYIKSNLRNSNVTSSPKPLRWFTRGWTLQELIAPTRMEFYDSLWNLKGLKSDRLVMENLSRITKICSDVLEDGSEFSLRQVSLGQRMSWAAYRDTSRVEDIAYCLLGIFQVNMPMLYGEGDRAFLRLQEEIIKSSTDLSIFGWCQDSRGDELYRGAVARKPREFRRLNDCQLVKSRFRHTEEITITNKGLRFHTSLFYPYYEGNILDKINLNFMDLGCIISGRPRGIFLTIMHDIHVRAEPTAWIEITNLMRRGQAHTIYLARDMDQVSSIEYMASLRSGIRFRTQEAEPYLLQCIDIWPPGIYDPLARRILVRANEMYVGFIKFEILDKSLPARQSRKVGDFISVCATAEGAFTVYLFHEEQATSFEAYAKSTSGMDPTTAEEELVKYLAILAPELRSEIIIHDGLSGRRLRVSARSFLLERPTQDARSTLMPDLMQLDLEID